MNKQRVPAFFAGLGILLALLAIDHWIFSIWFSTTHLQWYGKNGALIGLVSSVTSLAWGDMNRHTGLISSHPLDYLGSCFQLIGLPIYALGTNLRGTGHEPAARSTFDTLMAIPFLFAVVAVMAIWLVVVVPLQYFLFLICGAPARVLSRSKKQPIARFTGTRLEISKIDNFTQLPEGWWSASLSKKPVAMTNLFVSLFFLMVRLVTG
ncbi:MAG: hypothetical protein GXY53_04735 [Desulfobulbus sp.]|nr:hypothetical protein [Desulfobulbus sp.]